MTVGLKPLKIPKDWLIETVAPVGGITKGSAFYVDDPAKVHMPSDREILNARLTQLSQQVINLKNELDLMHDKVSVLTDRIECLEAPKYAKYAGVTRSSLLGYWSVPTSPEDPGLVSDISAISKLMEKSRKDVERAARHKKPARW